jgi:hypothetical protein
VTAIEFLEQYEEAVRVVKRREREYKDETAMIDAVRSLSDNDGMPHGSGISKPTETKAIRLADKKLRLIQAKLDAIEVRQNVFDVVDRVEGVAGDVLFQRYILLKKWDAVYKAINYSETSTWRFYRAGLERVEQLIGIK